MFSQKSDFYLHPTRIQRESDEKKSVKIIYTNNPPRQPFISEFYV